MSTGSAPKFVHKPVFCFSIVYEWGLRKICEQYVTPCWKIFCSGSAFTHILYERHLLSHAHTARTKQTRLRRKYTYMRLLEGILRPSLNQVICGLGKLWICGAWMSAPSPWDTVWDLSPSTNPPMSCRNYKKKTKAENNLNISHRRETQEIHISNKRVTHSHLLKIL